MRRHWGLEEKLDSYRAQGAIWHVRVGSKSERRTGGDATVEGEASVAVGVPRAGAVTSAC